jgi:hypothetical protein
MSMEKEQESSASDFELMDREDEEQIIAELRGVPVDKFIYKNKRGEHELTYAGTKWVVRQMAELGEAIRVDGHPKYERCVLNPEYITCTVLGKRIKVDREAKSETVLDTTIGSARQWSKQKINEGKTIIDDEHFFSKCISRATRNLQLSLIPTDFKKVMIEKLKEMQAKGGGQGQNRPPQGQQNRQQSSPAGHGPPGGAGPGGPAQGAAAPGGAQKPAGPAQGPQQPPVGAAAPGGQPRPQGQPPANAGQQKQTQPQRPQTQQRPANPSEASLEAVQQGFRGVFLQFAGTEDKPTLQKILKALTGKIAITDLERGLMVELGPLLRRKIKGELKWNGTALHEIKTGEQLWPKPAPQEEPMPEPQHEEAPPPQDDGIPMF